MIWRNTWKTRTDFLWLKFRQNTKMNKLLLLDPLLADSILLSAATAKHLKDWHIVDIAALAATATDRDVESIVTVSTPVDAKLLDRFPNTRIVSVSFTSYNHVDLKTCRDRGITVCNVPAYATDSVAELTVGLAISILRHIPESHGAIRSGAFDDRSWKTAYVGTELAGKTVGIIGTGAIGMRVAELFNAFHCRLLGWSNSVVEARRRGDHGVSTVHPFTAIGGEFVDDLVEMFACADILTVHVALNDQTRGLIGGKELAAMKPGAVIINTARGPIIDREALVDRLRQGKIRAGLDVYEVESVTGCAAFREMDNVMLTPHVAYKTQEALNRKAEITLANIARFVSGKPTNVVSL